MLLSRIARELQNGVNSSFGPNRMFGFSRIRRFHRSTALPETCFIMGRYGKIPLSGKRWAELDDFLWHKPILNVMPSNCLYTDPLATRPFMTNDGSRYLLKSGLFLPYFSNKLGRSYSGAYRMENVGVVKDLGVLAFRELNEDPGGKWLSNPACGYNEYNTFVNGVITRHHPAAVGFRPKEMSAWIDMAGREFIEEEFLVYHPAHLPDDEYGYMMLDLYKVLAQRYRQIGSRIVRESIYLKIAGEHSDFLGVCQDHAILNNFLPEGLRNPALLITPPYNAADYSGFLNAICGGPVDHAAKLAKSGRAGLSGIRGATWGLAAGMDKTGSGVLHATGGPAGTGRSIQSLPTITAMATAGSAGGVPSGGPTSAATGGSGGPAVVFPSAGTGNHPGTGSSESNLPMPTLTARTADEKQFLLGFIVVSTFRHGSVHSDEQELRELLLFLPDESINNLENAPLGIEVIRLFRYNFPLYLSTACDAFWVHRDCWEELELRRRNPIPTIYFAEPQQ